MPTQVTDILADLPPPFQQYYERESLFLRFRLTLELDRPLHRKSEQRQAGWSADCIRFRRKVVYNI